MQLLITLKNMSYIVSFQYIIFVFPNTQMTLREGP